MEDPVEPDDLGVPQITTDMMLAGQTWLKNPAIEGGRSSHDEFQPRWPKTNSQVEVSGPEGGFFRHIQIKGFHVFMGFPARKMGVPPARYR